MDLNTPAPDTRMDAMETIENRPRWMEIDLSFGDFSALSKLQKLGELLKEFTRLIKPETSVGALQEKLQQIQGFNVSYCPETREILQNNTTLNDEHRDVIITEVLTTRVDVSRATSNESVKCSVPVVISQVTSLYNAWKEIKDGKLVAEVSESKIPEIDEKVKQLEELCEEMGQLVNDFKEKNRNPVRNELGLLMLTKEQQRQLSKIELMYKQINSLYRDVKTDLAGLKLNVDSQLLNLKFVKCDHMDKQILKATILPKIFENPINFALGLTGIGDYVAAEYSDRRINHLKTLATKIYQLDELMRKVDEVRSEAKNFLRVYERLDDDEDEEDEEGEGDDFDDPADDDDDDEDMGDDDDFGNDSDNDDMR